MTYTPSLIAPYRSGLINYYKPWLIGNDAFEVLEDAYSWRGVVRKREGYQLLAIIGQHVDNANATFTIDVISNANPAAVTTSAAHNLATGDIVTFRNAAGMTQINGLTTAITVTGATQFTCNSINSTEFGIYTSGATIHLPIQGLETNLITTTGDEDLIAFTRYKAYRFNNTTQVFDLLSTYSSGAAITFTGTNDDFFWSTNYANAMWVTNNVDEIHFYQNTTAPNGWNMQRPLITAADRLEGARIIIPYRGRLVVLNTTETAANTRYRQRARWSQIGTPYVAAAGGDPAVTVPAPFATDNDAWRQDIIGKGGYIDADTSEEIISVAIVNDTLIVFFERSTWRLRYTGNQVLPFLWERISVEYGSDSRDSTVVLENAAYTYNRFAYVAADTNQVSRFDLNVPDLSSDVETNTSGTALSRIQAVRDLYKQFMYWAYPDKDTNADSPNKVAAYNYIDKSWALFNQSFRTFGRYKTFNDLTWALLTQNWASTAIPWQSVLVATNFPQVLSGATNGDVYVTFTVRDPGDDNGTAFNFDIRTKRFNPYIEKGMTCRLEYVDLYVTATNGGAITLDLYINDDDDNPVLTRTVSTSLLQNAKYTRVFLGEVANFHQIRLYLSDEQLADTVQSQAIVELQGMVIWTRPEGRIKDL